MPPRALAVGTGALAVGAGALGALGVLAYACVLYERTLRLRRHQMYLDGMLRTLETLVSMRR